MAELKGTQVAAIVVPFTDADKYATHDAEYGKGGFRSVSTIADRDAIPVERKTEGMIVRVTANGLNYEWKNNAWADSRTMGATTFDCTGGKYVYYVIPSSLGTPEFWVGGLKNTDVVTTSATVTNASGGSTTYSIMRLANIQTGVLSIQFK